MTADNSGGPANTAPAGGTLPGTNGPEKPRMIAETGTFYARLRLSGGGSREES